MSATFPDVDVSDPHDLTERAYTIAGVRAVVGGRIVEDARVTAQHGRIVEVATGTRIGRHALDGGGALLIAGLIDTHTDGLEKERAPRQTSTLDSAFALRSFEARLWSWGITTAFHGVGFDDRPTQSRTLDIARELHDTIEQRRAMPSAPVDHRVLYRLEARSTAGFDALVDCLQTAGHGTTAGHGRSAGAGDPAIKPLVSYEDHTPGQGQYRDINRFLDAVSEDRLAEGETAHDRVRAILEAAKATEAQAQQNRSNVASLAAQGSVTALAHDVEDADGVALAHSWGATIAEFPLTVAAASAARQRDMAVVAGGPNALRGESHSGNVSARELVAAGLCTVLASDYLPSSLLGAVWLLAHRRVATLPAALALVTSGPADAVGLADRGRIAEGYRADLVLVANDGMWPQVRAVARNGRWSAMFHADHPFD